MRNVAPFKRRTVSLTALIDVVFILLLFFMLTSTFSTFGEIELNPPTGGQAQPGESIERSFLQVSPDGLILNGTAIELDDLAGEIEADIVLVSLDDDVTSQRLVDLLALLRGRDDLNVLVLE